jgi:hypothetical protein
MNKEKVESFLKAVGRDFKNIKFEETDKEVKMKIGNFFVTREINEDYDYAVKRLFEDFLSNTTAFYTNIFWEQ